MPEEIKILKVRFDKITLDKAVEQAITLCKGVKQHQICTPNPEFLLEAQKNPKFLRILNNSSLNIADGIGILWAAKFLSKVKETDPKRKKNLRWLFSLSSILFFPPYIRTILPERVTGTDLMMEICKKCPNQRIKIFLLGGQEGVAEKTKDILETKFPGLHIVGTFAGSPKEKDEKQIIDKINKSEAKILFVAFGAPEQEIWINRNLSRIPKVTLAMGVGGAFDFISGTKKRAPKWMQKIGLEWLYRLLQQPKRIIRIYNATIKFPLAVLRSTEENPSIISRLSRWISSWTFFPKR